MLEIQHEVLPNAKTIATLFNPLNPTNPPFLAHLGSAASAMGMTVLPFPLKSPDELDSIFAALAAQQPAALTR